MKLKTPVRALTVLLPTLCLLSMLTSRSVACPFCIAPPETWSENLAKADVILIGEVVELHLFSQQIKVDVSAETVFRIRGVLKAPGHTRLVANRSKLLQELVQTHAPAAPAASLPADDPAGCPFQIGRCVTVQEYVTAKPGDLYLLTGQHAQPVFHQDNASADSQRVEMAEATQLTDDSGSLVVPAVATQLAAEENSESESQPESTATAWRCSFTLPELIEWGSPAPMTSQRLEYVVRAPSADLPQHLRLAYFVSFLESPDAEIAADAWGEFARSSYEHVVKVRQLFSNEALRRWIADPATGPERLGLYGMMLGLAGTAEDREFLKQQIGPASGTGNFRYGAEGLMGGYLLLAGEQGLQYLEDTRLRRPDASAEELFAVIQAVQFIWSYESGVITPSRLRQSLHLLLDNSQMREVVITDLARWKDWDTAPRLLQIFDQLESSDERSRKAIVGFMLALQRASSGESVPDELLAQANGFLDRVKTTHPQMLRTAQREFGPPQSEY